jgi:hypothetical protein
MLWNTLSAHYPDQATFAPSIAVVVTTWCDAFTRWLEDEANEEPVEKLLDAVKGGTLNIVLEVRPVSGF